MTRTLLLEPLGSFTIWSSINSIPRAVLKVRSDTQQKLPILTKSAKGGIALSKVNKQFLWLGYEKRQTEDSYKSGRRKCFPLEAACHIPLPVAGLSLKGEARRERSDMEDGD